MLSMPIDTCEQGPKGKDALACPVSRLQMDTFNVGVQGSNASGS